VVPHLRRQRHFVLREHGLLRQVTIAYAKFVSAAFLPLLNAGAKNVKGYASQIINTSSISGIMKGASGGQFAYAGSKQAVVQVSRRFLFGVPVADNRCPRSWRKSSFL